MKRRRIHATVFILVFGFVVTVALMFVISGGSAAPIMVSKSSVSTDDSKIAPLSQSSREALTPMEFCLVGDLNNPPDEITDTGSIGYLYEIGKYEVTNAQYCEFLNAGAKNKDPYGLYSVNMQQGFLGGIRRSAKEGQYHYEPLDGFANLPVNYVTWFNAARFCNWLHYGKPNIDKTEQDATEGDDKHGAYNTREFDSDPRGPQKVQKHNPGAKYWIPSLEEWNKAAYYDPTKNGKGGYWLYPTRSDHKPAAVPPGDTPNSANYYDRKWATGEPFLTPVGSYRKAATYYGTFDQAGNLWEWIETLRLNSNQRWVRGGACTSYANTLVRTNTDSEFGDHRLYCFGFRVCRIPTSIPKASP